MSLIRSLALPVLLCTTLGAFAQAPGTLDSTFSGDGKLVLMQFKEVIDLALREDGRILILTTDTMNVPVVVALTNTGELDSTFGVAGVCPALGNPRRILLGHDGKLTVFGGDRINRLDSLGALDPGFGVSGSLHSSNLGGMWISDADRFHDDRLLITGGNGFDAMTTKLTYDGDIDSSFGANGFIHRNGWVFTCPLGGSGTTVSFSFAGRRCMIREDGGYVVGIRQFIQGTCLAGPSQKAYVNVEHHDSYGNLLGSVYNTTGMIAADLPDPAHLLHNSHGCTYSVIDPMTPWCIPTCSLEDGTSFIVGHPSIGSCYSPALISGCTGRMAEDQHGFVFLPMEVVTPNSPIWKLVKVNPCTWGGDTSWCQNGGALVQFDLASATGAAAVIVAVDGKVITGGYAQYGGLDRLALARYHNIPDPRAKLSPRLFLGGPYNPVIERMHDSLRVQGHLPAVSPYQAPEFVAVGSPTYQAAFATTLDFTGDSAIVDWVWIELLSAADTATVVAARAALLRRDGLVTGMDGRSAVDMNCGSGSFFVRMRHRNHLGVTASDPITLGATSTAIDFTSVLTNTFGTDAQDEINGRRMLWPGDVTGDGRVKYSGAANDRDPILLQIGGSIVTNVVLGYLPTDVNLDGRTSYAGLNNDRDRILLTLGGAIPTTVRLEQVP